MEKTQLSRPITKTLRHTLVNSYRIRCIGGQVVIRIALGSTTSGIDIYLAIKVFDPQSNQWLQQLSFG